MRTRKTKYYYASSFLVSVLVDSNCVIDRKPPLWGFLFWLQSNPEPSLRKLIKRNQVSVEMDTDKFMGVYPMVGNNPALSYRLTTGNCTYTEPTNCTVAEDYPLSAGE